MRNAKARRIKGESARISMRMRARTEHPPHRTPTQRPRRRVGPCDGFSAHDDERAEDRVQHAAIVGGPGHPLLHRDRRRDTLEKGGCARACIRCVRACVRARVRTSVIYRRKHTHTHAHTRKHTRTHTEYALLVPRARAHMLYVPSMAETHERVSEANAAELQPIARMYVLYRYIYRHACVCACACVCVCIAADLPLRR